MFRICPHRFKDVPPYFAQIGATGAYLDRQKALHQLVEPLPGTFKHLRTGTWLVPLELSEWVAEKLREAGHTVEIKGV